VPVVYNHVQYIGYSPRKQSQIGNGRLSSAKISTRSSKMKLEKADESKLYETSMFK